MTRTPERVSRITRLIRSIFFWRARNSGIALYITVPMSAIMIGMITSRTPDSGTSWRSAMIRPPTTRIGAEIIMGQREQEDLLDLLDVVGVAGDEAGRAERVDLDLGERLDLAEDAAPDVPAEGHRDLGAPVDADDRRRRRG